MYILIRVVYREEPIVHALKVMRAVRLDNYHQFTHLHRTTPNMGNKLLDLMIDNTRLQYLSRLCKSHKPTVPVSYIATELGYTLTPYTPLKHTHTKSYSHSRNNKKHITAIQKELMNIQNNSIAIQFLIKAGCIISSSIILTDTTSNASSTGTGISEDGQNYDLPVYIEDAFDINTKDTVVDFTAVLNQDKLL